MSCGWNQGRDTIHPPLTQPVSPWLECPDEHSPALAAWGWGEKVLQGLQGAGQGCILYNLAPAPPYGCRSASPSAAQRHLQAPGVPKALPGQPEQLRSPQGCHRSGGLAAPSPAPGALTPTTLPQATSGQGMPPTQRSLRPQPCMRYGPFSLGGMQGCPPWPSGSGCPHPWPLSSCSLPASPQPPAAPAWLSRAQCLSRGGQLLGTSCHYVPDVTLLSFLLFGGTFLCCTAFKHFKSSRYFPTGVSGPQLPGWGWPCRVFGVHRWFPTPWLFWGWSPASPGKSLPVCGTAASEAGERLLHHPGHPHLLCHRRGPWPGDPQAPRSQRAEGDWRAGSWQRSPRGARRAGAVGPAWPFGHTALPRHRWVGEDTRAGAAAACARSQPGGGRICRRMEPLLRLACSRPAQARPTHTAGAGGLTLTGRSLLAHLHSSATVSSIVSQIERALEEREDRGLPRRAGIPPL